MQKTDFITEKKDTCYWVGDYIGRDRSNFVLEKASQKVFVHILSNLEQNSSWMKNDFSYYSETQYEQEYLGKLLTNKEFYNSEIKTWINSTKKKFSTRNIEYIFVTDQTNISDFILFMSTLKKK